MDLLDRVQRELTQRLNDLRPLVEEARRLEDVLSKLAGRGGGATSQSARQGQGSRARAATSASSRAGSSRRTASTSRRRQGRGRRGARMSGDKRREQVLSIIRENPEIKAREIAQRTKTTPNNIYNVIRRLEADGKLSRSDGRFVVRS